MKKISLLSFALVMIMGSWSCSAQSDKKQPAASASEEVNAYYFHFTNRCVTCRTVEEEAKASIASLYGDKVSFQSLNLDDEFSRSIAEKLHISGQTLLVVKGDTRIDLTNDGFLYARSNPEKFKAIIKEKVDPLL